MTRRRIFEYTTLLLSLAAYALTPCKAQQKSQPPETVMVTLHAKPGAEAELQRVLARHWTTAHDMKLVADAPHVTIRGAEDGDKTYFVDIFTWRDAAIPDSAPPEIRKLWDDMNRLVEARGSRPPLEFVPVSVVAP
jgi:hypothetical protein